MRIEAFTPTVSPIDLSANLKVSGQNYFPPAYVAGPASQVALSDQVSQLEQLAQQYDVTNLTPSEAVELAGKLFESGLIDGEMFQRMLELIFQEQAEAAQKGIFGNDVKINLLELAREAAANEPDPSKREALGRLAGVLGSLAAAREASGASTTNQPSESEPVSTELAQEV